MGLYRCDFILTNSSISLKEKPIRVSGDGGSIKVGVGPALTPLNLGKSSLAKQANSSVATKRWFGYILTTGRYHSAIKLKGRGLS